MEDPEAGHDLVPVQVGALQVSERPGFADVAPSAVQDTPVIKDHHIACKEKKKKKGSKNSRLTRLKPSKLPLMSLKVFFPQLINRSPVRQIWLHDFFFLVEAIYTAHEYNENIINHSTIKVIIWFHHFNHFNIKIKKKFHFKYNMLYQES